MNESDDDSPVSEGESLGLVGDEFDYSTADIQHRDFRVEFGLIIIFPLVVMLVILVILSYVMFGRREGV